ncbi:fas-binding factor 1-like [Zingiber officinale]|uniref:fas-binding factor 1-like n=1 Tax=Zingiber officinale TaxID=94328 RepID=UPI001C4D695F|nr:fas-binding factor 1-like [Zingiber officinale]
MATPSPAWFLSCASGLIDSEEVELQVNYGFPSYMARRANPTTSTLGLLSKEEQAAEALASLEEEEEQPFVAIHKKPRLTSEVPFRDTFGTFVQIPIVPSAISYERVASASQVTATASASSQPLPLALSSLASGPRAKRTPCRRSSSSPGPSATCAPSIDSTFLALPSSIPSGPSSVVPSSTTSFLSLPSSSTRPPSPSVPTSLFRQAFGLPSQLGQTSDPPIFGSIQLQGPLAESWLHSQELLKGTSISSRVDSHKQLLFTLERDNRKLRAQVETLKTTLPPSHIDLTQSRERVTLQTQQLEDIKKELQHRHQLLENKELERKTLELQVDRLNSRLQVETALKDKVILDVSHKNTVLEKVERLHNIFLSEQAQDSASKEFALLQEQE